MFRLLQSRVAPYATKTVQVPVRQFSLLQNELEKHDFSDVLNVAELKLKNPEKKEKMNLY